MEKKVLPDTPWHVGYTKKDESDPRRHKSRCVYINNGICSCGRSGCYAFKCVGSSHCRYYSEESKDIAEKKSEELRIEVAVRDNFARSQKQIRIVEKVFYRGREYCKIRLNDAETIMVPYSPKLTKKEILLFD